MKSTYKQIADDLKVNKTTVRRHLERIEQQYGKEYIEQQKTKIKDTFILSEELTEKIKNSIQEQQKIQALTNKGNKYTPLQSDAESKTAPVQSGTNGQCTPVQTDTKGKTIPVQTGAESKTAPVQSDARDQIIETLKNQIEDHKNTIEHLKDQISIKDHQIQRLTDQLEEITTALKQQQSISAMFLKQLETATPQTPEEDPEESKEKRTGILKRIFKKQNK